MPEVGLWLWPGAIGPVWLLGMMTSRVVASALSDLRVACWLACPAGSFVGVQGCGTARAAARGRGAAPHPAETPVGLGRPRAAGRADQAPAEKAAGAPGWSRRAPSWGGNVAWSPGSGPFRAARDAQSQRRVLCRAVIGAQGRSRSKRQGWTRPASRDRAPPTATARLHPDLGSPTPPAGAARVRDPPQRTSSAPLARTGRTRAPVSAAFGSCTARILGWVVDLRCRRRAGHGDGWLSGCWSRSSTC